MTIFRIKILLNTLNLKQKRLEHCLKRLRRWGEAKDRIGNSFEDVNIKGTAVSLARIQI